MKIITINVAEKHLELFDAILDTGLVPSRSEVMRLCLVLGMKELLKHLSLIEKTTEDLRGEEELVRIPTEMSYDTEDEEENSVNPKITMAELRKKYPALKDYNFANEDRNDTQ